jgi:hypothetical protein
LSHCKIAASRWAFLLFAARTLFARILLAKAQISDMLWREINPGKEFVHDCYSSRHVDELRSPRFQVISAGAEDGTDDDHV